MNEFHDLNMQHPKELGLNIITPKYCIVYYSDSNDNNCYFQFHKISDRGTLLYGKPLYEDTLRGLLKSVEIKNKNDWFIKDRIKHNILSLSLDRKRVVWCVKRPKEYLHFSNDVKSGLYFLPTIIFTLENNDLSVFALKKVGDNSILYHAPFYNVYKSGNVCMGNVKLEFNRYEINHIIEQSQKAFFGSLFTHTNNGNIIENIDFVRYMNSICNTNKPFDNNYLKSTSIKLSTLL